jgi:hypothetical protein
MKRLFGIIIFLIYLSSVALCQENPFAGLDFLYGYWSGTGSGFGNNQSKIESSFHLIMDGKYIEVINESRFEPTEKNPEGEHHIDKGFISFDNSRKVIVFRQFNNEGYVNQYVLNDSLSNDSTLVFETVTIENFMPGGKARWTIKKIDDKQIETVFDVSFPGKEFACFGTNTLYKKE